MIKIFAAATAATFSFAHIGWSDGSDRPSCQKLEALYIALGEKSGKQVSDAEVKEAVYGENPTDADCAMMLSLFPAQE